MKILMITRKAWPHVGGVERHLQEVSLSLRKRGNKVKIISEKEIKYPHIKFIGLIYIWLWFLKNSNLIEKSDIVHIHDVFIWYLPFRFLYPNKKAITTFHGWEGVWPIPLKNIILKRIANRLSVRSVAVGKYIEKYYGIKADKIIYGGVKKLKKLNTRKINDSLVFIGRLEKDTGLTKFLEWLNGHMTEWSKVEFVGDGPLRGECEKFGKVYGFTNSNPFLQKAEICVPGGYLAALEALSYGCKLKLFWNNEIKKDYWQMSPFVKKDAENWAKKQTWDKLTNEYLDLYNSI